MGGIPWILIAEVLPEEVKPNVLGLASGLNWGISIAVSSAFPLIDTWSPAGAWLLFSLLNLAGYAYLHAHCPETEGWSLEEIRAHVRTRWVSGPASAGAGGPYRRTRRVPLPASEAPQESGGEYAGGGLFLGSGSPEERRGHPSEEMDGQLDALHMPPSTAGADLTGDALRSEWGKRNGRFSCIALACFHPFLLKISTVYT